MSITSLAIVALCCLVAGGLSYLLILRGMVQADNPAALTETAREPAISVLMRDGALHDLSEAAQSLFNALPEDEDIGDWARLRQVFGPRFAGFPDAPPENSTFLKARQTCDAARLSITSSGRSLRLEIHDIPATSADLHGLRMAETELETLRTAMYAAPSPVWQTDDYARLLWANRAYRALATELGRGAKPGDASLFDLPPLADQSQRTLRTHVDLPAPDPKTIPPSEAVPMAVSANTIDAGPMRQTTLGIGPAHRPSDKRRAQSWFDISSVQSGQTVMNYAMNINAVVKAEIAQRNFVQTLTKTFAHLPIGLAIFNRNRQLALFNPALIDLTALPADFLSARPNLLSFFDHLREKRMMPEPKNYKGWREQMADLVAAASDDRYCETWNLPSGLTYKVTGRPHPDGAIAFVIEDISAEISLTRRFRSELELTQSVIDSFESAVVVFSSSGVLTFSNDAYRNMWNTDPDSAFAEMTILDASRLWQEQCKPTPIWGDLRDSVMGYAPRTGWAGDLRHADGARIDLRCEPVAGGATMIRFDAPVLALTPLTSQEAV